MKKLLFFIALAFSAANVSAQNVPLNFPLIQDYMRRLQVIGEIDSELTFHYRPVDLHAALPDFETMYGLASSDSIRLTLSLVNAGKNDRFEISLLPLQLNTVYNSSYPYTGGNGPMVPARGPQTLLSGGMHVRFGRLSMQVLPQFQWAQNLPFEEYPENAPLSYFQLMNRGLFGLESPVRHGRNPITRILPGNSHLKLDLNHIAIGLSTENIWWGPSQYNALLLGDNAQGFTHFTIHSQKPLKTPIGNFEGQYFVGMLEGLNIPHFSDGAFDNVIRTKEEEDWRYFTGISISYSPKWLPGLSLGVGRTFQIYRNDMQDTFRAYFPLFVPLYKEGEGIEENVELREDQNINLFSRWVIPGAKFEMYMEYIRNDHEVNARYLLLNPEHSRGFTLGFAKYVRLPDDSQLEIKSEYNRTQISINNIIRWPGAPNNGLGLYDNYQVRHGLTHRGQILGPGTGTSGNFFKVEINKVHHLDKVGITFERYGRERNFYQYALTSGESVKPWTDLTMGINYEKKINQFLISTVLRGTASLNYNFYAETPTNDPFSEGRTRYNLNNVTKVAYLF
ncbi:capsule assembly Wzi family protein [Anditalea andensis]|uniref:Capsule assembly protein Wzi n=1 Tax=Anditalea andensis TaxID=1048983 RepID=A0A074KPX1_9BACT|nr:capsule assembly Wzi family protein [Anditalea andensis]KEO72001.1 hypothetical protein EL17_20135 [Anditalea andensis]